jgi:hypothetical protein
VNKRELKKIIGTIVKFRPRPKQQDEYLSDARNQWDILNETGDGLLCQNALTNHEFTLHYDSIREFRNPDLLILLGQVHLRKGGQVEIEVFTDSPPEEERDEASEIVSDRRELAKAEFEKLDEAQKMGLRELLVRDSMTDTDLERYLESKGFKGYQNFYNTVSEKTSFLDRNIIGFNSVRPAFRKIIAEILNPKTAG